MRRKNSRSPATRALFLLYCVAMFWLLFGQRIGEPTYLAKIRMNINLTPMRTIRQYLHLLHDPRYTWHAFVNLFGNVLMFIPLGYLLPKIWVRYRKFFRLIFYAFLVLIAVEVTQYFTMLGSLDVDDIILNLAGVIIGYFAWLLFKAKK